MLYEFLLLEKISVPKSFCSILKTPFSYRFPFKLRRQNVEVGGSGGGGPVLWVAEFVREPHLNGGTEYLKDGDTVPTGSTVFVSSLQVTVSPSV